MFRQEVRHLEPNPLLDEIQGYVGLGMKRDALRLVGELLTRESITGDALNTALDAILTHEERLGDWIPLVETAYRKLANRFQPSVRFLMLSFYVGNREYTKARRFLPRRFGGGCALLELAFAMDIWLAQDRMDRAGKLLRRCVDGIEVAEHPEMRAILADRLMAYFRKLNERITGGES